MRNGTSVYQKPDRPHYYCAYWCTATQRRVMKATHFRVDDPHGYKNALKFADEKAREARTFQGSAPLELWHVWAVKHLESTYADAGQARTLGRYLEAWDTLRSFIADRGLQHPQSWRYKHVVEYVDWRTSQKRKSGKAISRNTALLEVKVLGVLFREAIRREYCTTNPCARTALKRSAVAEKPEITDAEVELIQRLLAERDARKNIPLADRWMSTSFQIALHHGCLMRETSVPFSAINFDDQSIRFSAKGGKVFTATIHPAILPLLKEISATGASHTCKLPALASLKWHKFFNRHGLKHLCFHCTRVTVVTRLVRAGVPVWQAMSYVAHSSQIVHRIYQRLKREDLTQCSDVLAYPRVASSATPQTAASPTPTRRTSASS